jgi:hypothetical protein
MSDRVVDFRRGREGYKSNRCRATDQPSLGHSIVDAVE